MKRAREEAVEVVRWRPWCDVHEDILRLIFSKLYFADQTTFHAVCKGWRSLVYGGRSKEKLPWLLNRVWYPKGRGSNRFIENELSDLYNQKTYVIRDDNFPNYFLRAHVLASRHGWLLLGKAESNGDNISWSMFVYNPLTRQVIDLPILDLKFDGDINATFSSAPPTSPKCLFFVCCNYSDDTFDIRMFQYDGRNEMWTTVYLSGWVPYPLGRAASIVYINGVLYCAFQWGESGVFAFDVENKQGQWLGEGHYNWSFLHSNYLVEANGELLWSICSYDGKWNIFKLDFRDNKTSWIPQKTLENQALFAGCTSFLVPAVGDASFLANKIYYYDDCMEKLRVYCLLSGKRHENDKIYNCIGTPFGQKVWIEPSW